MLDHPDIDPGFSLPQPLSYAALMQKLEEMNLVSPIAGTSSGTGSGSSNPSRPRKVPSSLSKAHHSKVCSLSL